MPPPPGGGALNQRGPGGGGGPGGGDGPQMVIMEGGNGATGSTSTRRSPNLFNYVNYNTFIGNQLSPFFGTATSAAARRAAWSWAFHLGFDEEKAQGRRHKAESPSPQAQR